MKIGELAKQTECSVQTIRYYEKEGLIQAAGRSEGNFRLYDMNTIERLLFIKHCRGLNLSLSEIRHLLHLYDTPSACCEDINLMIERHINEVEQRINDLKALRTKLKALHNSCSTNRTVERCGILLNISNH